MCWSPWATPQSTSISLLKNFSLIENHWDLNFWGSLFWFFSIYTNYYIRAIHKTRAFSFFGQISKRHVVWNMGNEAWLSLMPQIPMSFWTSHLIFLFLTSPLRKGKLWYFCTWKYHLTEATVFMVKYLWLPCLPDTLFPHIVPVL